MGRRLYGTDTVSVYKDTEGMPFSIWTSSNKNELELAASNRRFRWAFDATEMMMGSPGGENPPEVEVRSWLISEQNASRFFEVSLSPEKVVELIWRNSSEGGKMGIVQVKPSEAAIVLTEARDLPETSKETPGLSL